jgi:hypothetical protein
VDDKAADDKAADDQAAEGKASDDKAAEDKAVGNITERQRELRRDKASRSIFQPDF